MNELPSNPNEPTLSEVSHLIRRLHESEAQLRTLTGEPGGGAAGTAAHPSAEWVLRERLRKCEERFQQLFSAATTGMAISTPRGRFLQANPAYCDMLGYTETELQSLDWESLTHHDDLTVNVQLRDQLLSGQRHSFVMEKRYIRKSEETLSTRISVSAVHEASGEISTFLVMAEDVTQRNVAHARLKRLNRLHAALSKISEAILRTPSPRELYDVVCRSAVEYGQLRMVFVAEVDAGAQVASPVASCGAGLAALLGPEDAISIAEGPMSLGAVGAALRSGNCNVCNDIAPASQLEPWREAALKYGLLANVAVPLRCQGIVVGVLALYAGEIDFFLKDEVELIASVAHTMSFALEAWEREQHRRQAEARSIQLAEVLESSADPILSHDINGIITSWNRGSEKTFGYSASEVVGTSFFQLVPEEHRDYERQITDQVVNGSEGMDSHETIRLTKSGQLIHVAVTMSPIKNANGGVIGVSRVSRDITHAKRAEARMRRLMDSNIQGVFFWDVNGSVTDANDEFLALSRFTREDLKAAQISWTAMTPPEYEHLDRRALQAIAENAHCTPYEKEFIRKDGSRVPILIGAATFEDMPNEGVCFVVDLSAQKKLERQVLQAQKMESIGALAAGVAHDFNNILAVVQIQAELLQSDDALKRHHLEAAGDIIAAVDRAAALTRQLLLFSSREMFQPCDLELSEAIADTMKMLKRILGEHIQMEVKLDSHPLYIHADRGMIDQVLLNLVVNARDAMPLGGRLIIETSCVDIDGLVALQSSQERAGSFVCLSVSDSGCGIPAADLPRIFEPFFTTKDVGRGTGLGLATVFGIVRQHEG